MNIKEMRELGFKVQDSSSIYSNIALYSNSLNIEDFELNKDTKVTTLKYKNKIGLSLHKTIKNILSRENQVVLLEAGAGGGKTFSMMQATSEIIFEQDNLLNELKNALIEEIENNKQLTVNKVAYVLPVPTMAQAIQNEVGEDLKQFHYTKVIGRQHGEQTDINEDIPLYTPVFDSTLKVVQELVRQGYKVKLIVDESHKLISDIGYRAKALYEIEQSTKLASLVVHMTATSRKNINLYEYDEIFKLVNTNQQNNIKNFKVVYTNNWETTLVNHIVDLISKGFIPLIRLNSYKDIESIRNLLKDEYDIDSKILSAETKNDEIFKSIQEKGKVGDKLQALFCTSVIECGISIKQDNVAPVEVIKEASDFDKDNSIQFFARPRVKVERGIMIIKNYRYVNKDGKSITTLRSFKEVFDYESKIIMNQFKNLYNEVENNLEVYGFNRAKEELKSKMAVYRNNRGFIDVFDVDYSTLMIHINKKKVLNYIYSKMDEEIITRSPLMFRECFKDAIFYDSIEIDTEQHYKNIGDMIENGLELKLERVEDELGNDILLLINNKVLIGEGAENYENDTEVKVVKALLYLQNKKKCLSEIVLDIYEDDKDMEIAKLLKSYEKYDVIKAFAEDLIKKKKIREERAKINEINKSEELRYRLFFEDKNFNKALKDIINEEINSDNIKKYNLKQSLKDIISFRESELCEVFLECNDVFGTKDAIRIITHHKVNKKGQKIYYSYKLIRKICRLKYFINKDKKNIEYGNDIYDIIAQIVEANRKNGKQINLTKKLGIILITELIRNKYYNGIKGSKEVKQIIKDIELEEKLMASMDIKYEFYNKENIKKLEQAISSNLKDRLMDDLFDIYGIGADSKGYTIIKSFKKDFNLNEYLK